MASEGLLADPGIACRSMFGKEYRVRWPWRPYISRGAPRRAKLQRSIRSAAAVLSRDAVRPVSTEA